MKRKNGYVQVGLTAFLTVGAILLFYDTLFGNRVVLQLWRQFMDAITPILYGAVIAYLLVPIVNFFEKKLFAGPVRRTREAGGLTNRWVRAVSLLMTWALISFGAYLLFSVLFPELYASVLQLVGNVELYYRTILGWVQHLLETNPDVETWVMAQMDTYYQDINRWLTGSVLPQAQTLMTAVSGGIFSTLVFVKNMLVGVMASIYLLATKERCGAYARKLVYGFFPQENVHWVLRGAHRMDAIFSGFVRGKLLDSLIIGLICFAVCSLLDMPYTPLVSVIVGVTNIIPFFGPFLGAIPSLFLILLVSPLKALYFLIFILALQQVDGNIIGPKILGDRTGLSSLWVIIAILVGGSFFGLLGMFFGVPVCACLYYLVNFLVETRLRKRALPLETNAYTTDRPKGPPPSPEEPEEERPSGE